MTAAGRAEQIARQSYGKLVAYLAARTRDLAAAEDALADAFAAALGEWPAKGIPPNPEAWLLTVARRKIIDAARRRQTAERALLPADTAEEADEIPDRRLALIFACAHPALEASVRAPLILQTVMGFDAATIAQAFLIAPAAMGKRLVRAKLKIREARIPFRIPEIAELPERLGAVLEAIYGVYSEGWAEREEFAREALYLATLTSALLPDQPEALGLQALLLYAESRRGARRSAAGEFVPFGEQDPGRWNLAMIREAEALLARAAAHRRFGRFQTEAAIQSAHVERRLSGRDNRAAVLGLYDLLVRLTASPVAAINRALALAEVEGPAAGLAAIREVEARGYQPYWAALADLLARSGARAEARQAYDAAISLTHDAAVIRFLRGRRGATLND